MYYTHMAKVVKLAVKGMSKDFGLTIDYHITSIIECTQEIESILRDPSVETIIIRKIYT